MDRRTLTIAIGLFAGVMTSSTSSFADVAACISAAERAQALRASGHLLEARAALITCAAESCPTTVRGDCATWLTEVNKEIPSVVVQAKSGGGEDLADVQVIVDGAAAKSSLDGLPIPLDPGNHRLRFESAGRTAVEQSVILRLGERRALSVTMLRPDESATAQTPPAQPAPEPAAGIPTISWILGGASVALVGTGIALWAVGRGEKSDLDDGCGTTSSCAHDDIVASRTKLIVGDVLVGAGGLALGAGIYFALTSKRTSPAAVAVGPNGVFAIGRF